VAPFLIKALTSENSALKENAVAQLSKVNESEYIGVLVDEFILKGDQSQWDVAFAIFERVKDLNLMQKLSDVYNKIDSNDLKIRILALYGKRSVKSQSALILAACGSSDKKIRKQAFKSLGGCTSQKNLPQVIDLLLKSGSKVPPAGPELGITATIRNGSDAQKSLQLVRAALKKAKGKGKSPFMNTLSIVGDTADRKMLASLASQGTEVTVQKEAVKALTKNTSFTTAQLYPAIMKINENLSVRALCIEGLLNVIVNNRRANKKNVKKHLNEALKFAPREEDKKRLREQLKKTR
jgi:hypothetical protein